MSLRSCLRHRKLFAGDYRHEVTICAVHNYLRMLVVLCSSIPTPKHNHCTTITCFATNIRRYLLLHIEMDYHGGEYEFGDTVYTLTVYVPPRPPTSWLPTFTTHKPIWQSREDPLYLRIPEDTSEKPPYVFKHANLKDMAIAQVRIKSKYFPYNFRCPHVRESKECDYGCYLLEKGGKGREMCKRRDCEGHVYAGGTKMGEFGRCFGKKGTRLVALG